MRTSPSVRARHYPAFLDLAGRDALVVGGGEVAARRAPALVAAGADLRIVSPALCAALRTRHEAGELRWEAREARPGDTTGAALVICATDVPEVNAAVAEEARLAGIPVAVADDPAAGTFAVPASLARGPLQVAVATGGTSPSFAAFVRRHLEEALGAEFAELAELAARIRERARAAGVPAADRERCASAAYPELLDLLRAGRLDAARELADRVAAGHAVQPGEAAVWS